MKKIYTLIIALIVATVGMAQKPEKVMGGAIFKAMESHSQSDIDDNLEKAKADFKKILIKDKENPLAHFGLSVVYSYDKYSKKDYFEAWKHFQVAEKNQAMFTLDHKEVLNEFFFRKNKARRNRPINKNMEWERNNVEDKLIKFVREENKVELANRFLTEFPNSKYKENVEHIRTYIDYRTAENTNTVESYNGFLKQYPNAAQKNIAIAKRNKVAYDKAIAMNSLSALKAFVQKYPKAEQVEDAYKRMSLLAYDVAKKARTIEAIEQFMIAYPNSTKMPEAKVLKKQLLFEWAKSVNTIEAYNKFVSLYPEGTHYIDIFNLKANALGQQLLMDFPMENYKFIRGYDNQDFNDFGGAAIQRPNGEYLLLANSKPSEDKMYDTWLLGLDAEGKMVWNSFLGNEYDDFANKVVVTKQNQIFVAGITNAIVDSVDGQAWLYKLAPDGSNVYNAKLEGSAVSALGIFDDGSAIVSNLYKNPADSTIIPFIVKLNKNGKKLWSRTYSQPGKVYDLAVSGTTTYLTTGSWVCAINNQGYLVWDQFLSEGQIITAVATKANGSVIYAGKKGQEGYAVSYSAAGEKLWEQSYPSPGIGNYKDVTVLNDGKAILSGTFSGAIKISKIGANGAVIKSNEFRLPNGIKLNSIEATKDNSIIVSATRLGSKSDIIVFKLVF